LNRQSLRPKNNYLFDYQADRIINESDLGMRAMGLSGNPFCTIHRADLHAILIAAVRANDAECLQLGHGLSEIVDLGDAVALAFENGVRMTMDMVIGADGIRSAVRAALFDASKPVFTGNVAWRGVVDNRASDYRMDPADMGNWIGPGRNVVVYPIRGGRELNYVAISEREAWVEEGWNVRSTTKELIAEFAGWSPRMLAMFASTPPEKCFKWGLFDRDPMQEIARGRVALIGDAAHPMLPFLAQGSAMGIEDAIILARCVQTITDPAETLKAYEATRLPRTGWVQHQAREVRRLLHTQASPSELDAREERSQRIYGYDAVTTAISSPQVVPVVLSQ
jgi:salicylate hydroxylase